MLYLLLGANLGNRAATLAAARRLISARIGVIHRQSALYETAAWGLTDQPAFLNQVLAVTTELPPHDVLTHAQAIEAELGRVRRERWGARVIDIDLLYDNDRILQTDRLTLPHPYLHQRRFTLVPLAEIAPDFVHPVLHQTNAALLQHCTDTSDVTVFTPPPADEASESA